MSRERFAKITHDMPGHPKLLGVGYAARWLWIDSLAYCSQLLTDGVFPEAQTYAWADQAPEDAPKITRELTTARLWHEPGHDCPRCDQPPPRFLVVHDYLHVQTSAGDAKERTNRRRDAGSLGNHQRWCVKSARPIPGCRHCSTSQVGSHSRSQTDRIPIVEVEAEVESKQPARDASGKERAAAWLAEQTGARQDDCVRAVATKVPEDARNPLRYAQGIPLDDWRKVLPRKHQQQPATLNQCDGTDCPGERHTWTDKANRYLCLGDAT